MTEGLDERGSGEGDRNSTAFTVREVLAEAAAQGSRMPASAECIEEMRAELDETCLEVVAGLNPAALPLRAPKRRITDMLSCERYTLERLLSGPVTEALVRGTLVDLLVTHYTLRGACDDPLRVTTEALEAQRDVEKLGWLATADRDAVKRVDAALQEAQAHLETSWGPIDRSWWPRHQVQAKVWLAGGAVLCSAQFDLLLGGPLTGLPGVLVEVKSGVQRVHERYDLFWYALLGALSQGWAPSVVATWSAQDDALLPERVTEGTLVSAARRGIDALTRIAELAGGREPTETVGPWCRWCPARDDCPTWAAGNDKSEAGRAAVDDDDWDSDWIGDGDEPF